MINVLQKNQEKSECLSDVIDLVALEYAGGDGTESSPYLIENAEQLKLLAKEVNELHLDTLNKHYKLIKDIDLSGCNWTPIGEISDGSDSYNSYCFFRGVFDGNNFTVHNLTINKSEGSCLGLFGCITDKVSVHDSCYISPVIKNLTIKNVNIIGKSMIGSIVGRVDLSTNNTSDDKFSNLLIENCHVRKAKISALNDIGGLTGRSSNSVTFLNSDTYDIHITMNKDHYVSGGTSAGTTCSGGFVGKANGSYNAPGFFTNCHSFNVVINDSILQNGGFVGNTGQIVYNQCSAKSEILLSEEVGVQCGGFAGFSMNVDPSSAGYMRVGYNECSADAVIKGRTENLNLHGSAGTNGGFIGYSGSTQCYFTNCRVTGNIFGNSSTGGFIGSVQSYGTPGDSSAASFNDIVVSCKIYGSKENYTSVSPIFGTKVSEDSTINQLCERVYYDEEVCEISIREVGTGLKTGKLTGEAAKTNTGLDFVSTWQVIDGDYPKLSTIIENSPFENINIPNGWVAVGERQLQTAQKEIDHLINEVKSSVSDGKRLIASAITDKGVEASESDSFQTLAEKIAAITSSQSTVDVVKSSSDGKALELLGTTGDNFKKLSITSTMPEDSVNSNRRPYVSLTIDNGTSADNSEHFNETVEIELPDQLLSCGSAANELIQNEDGTIKFIKRADVVDTSWEQIFSQSLEVVNKKWKSFLINEKIYIVGGSKYSSVTSHTPYEKVSIFDLNTKQWSAGTDIPSPTEDFASIAIGDKIYIISGYSNSTYSQSVYVYDTMTNQWEKKADYPLDGMGDMSCVYAADTNCIYTCGGMGNYGRLNDKICKYDIASDSWTTLGTSFPSDGLSENGRYGMLMGYLSGGYIVFISGKVKGSPNLTTRYLSVNQLSWSEMAEIPALTTAHSIIHNQQENSFYVANLGTHTDEESLVYRFNYSRNEWSVIGKMPVKASLDGDTFIHNNQYIVVTDEASTNSNSVIKCYRGDLPFTLLIDDEFTVEVSEVEEDERILTGSPYGTIVDDKLYCFGGRVPSGFFNGIHVYDFKAKTLVKKEGTNWKNGGFVHAIGNKLHLLGGALPNASYDTEHDVYNIETDEWTKATKPPVESQDYQSVLVDSKIYLLGGWLASDTVGDCYVYDASTDAWTSIAPMPNPVYGGSACYYNGKIYVTGGYESSGQYSPPFYPSKKMSVYDIATDTWESLGDCQVARINHSSIEHNGKIYLIGGDCYENTSSRVQSTFDIYDVATKTWESCYPLHVNGYSRLNFVRGGHLYMYGNCTDYNRETFLFTKMLISDRAKLDKEIVSEISLPTPFKTCKGFTRIQVTNLKKATIEATVSCFK